MRIFHDPRCAEYERLGHPERPQRILATVPYLQEQHPEWTWEVPEAATRAELLRAHAAEYLEEIRAPSGDLDADCPAYPDLYAHAARSAGAALAAVRAALAGEKAFSLMRPPGHHALREHAMGFCYFGNVALAALDATVAGIADAGPVTTFATGAKPWPATAATAKMKRAAIWDFDAHHGNGTEALVGGNDRVIFASIHQYPGWPGTGTKSFANIHNFPVPPNSPRADHMRAIKRALETLQEFKPQLLLVSAGFDAYKNDPITEMTLEIEDFATMGKWLSEAHIPTAAILEGGYSDDLPVLVDAFLSAWDGN